jgi:ketosteroid isomerase-like protein
LTVKRCPTCNKTFADQNLSFCIDDGTPLLPVEPLDGSADEATLVRPAPGANETGSPGTSTSGSSGEGYVPPYQPPSSYLPPGSSGQRGKRKAWPWVLGCLAILLIVIVALVITAKILFPVVRNAPANTNNNYNTNVDRRNDSNSNLNASNSHAAPGNENSNDNSAADDTPPPTDKEEVLSNLTDLEHEWTVANINADKKKLDRILADDYVGTSEGKSQGKAEYLKTITRDTLIQKWDFEDLKVGLTGDRATLTGTIRLQVKDQQGQNQPVAYRFTDKFVWRDGRWQATGSDVSLLKE